MQRNIFQKCNTLFLVKSIEQSTCNEPPPSNVMTGFGKFLKMETSLLIFILNQIAEFMISHISISSINALVKP